MAEHGVSAEEGDREAGQPIAADPVEGVGEDPDTLAFLQPTEEHDVVQRLPTRAAIERRFGFEVGEVPGGEVRDGAPILRELPAVIRHPAHQVATGPDDGVGQLGAASLHERGGLGRRVDLEAAVGLVEPVDRAVHEVHETGPGERQARGTGRGREVGEALPVLEHDRVQLLAPEQLVQAVAVGLGGGAHGVGSVEPMDADPGLAVERSPLRVHGLGPPAVVAVDLVTGPRQHDRHVGGRGGDAARFDHAEKFGNDQSDPASTHGAAAYHRRRPPPGSCCLDCVVVTDLRAPPPS